MPPSPEDDRLLERLGQALSGASWEPSQREVDRVRVAADQRVALGRAVQALGTSIRSHRTTDMARHSADVRSHLRRWETTLGAQNTDRLVTEARQLLRQSRRLLEALQPPPLGSDGLTSSFL